MKKFALFEKYNMMTIQAKAAIWFVICSIMQKGISFIVVPIFTRLLSSEQYGTYSVYLSWLQILTVITSLYLYYGVLTNAMNKFEDDRDRYISSMQGLTVTLTTVLFIVFLCSKNIWSEWLGLEPKLILLMFVEMLINPALSFWSGRQRFEYRYKKLVAVTLARSLFNPILGLIVVPLADDKATARILSVIVIELLICGTLMIKQFWDGKCFFHLRYWKYSLTLAIPLLPHYLSGIILNKGDQIMIDKMIGTSEVAFYSVAYNVGMCVQIFTSALINSFTPWIYQKIKREDYDGIAVKIDLLNVLVAFLALCMMLCSPELIMIFGSSSYSTAAYVIPPVAASVFFIYLYNILSVPQFYYEKTRFLMVSSVLAAGLNILLNYVFIQRYGYIAAGYTTLICYIIYSFGHFLVSRKIMKEYTPGVTMYNYRSILALSVAVILSGIGCNYLFDYPVVRYGIIIVFTVVALKYRNSIVSMVLDMRKKGNK